MIYMTIIRQRKTPKYTITMTICHVYMSCDHNTVRDTAAASPLLVVRDHALRADRAETLVSCT